MMDISCAGNLAITADKLSNATVNLNHLENAANDVAQNANPSITEFSRQ